MAMTEEELSKFVEQFHGVVEEIAAMQQVILLMLSLLSHKNPVAQEHLTRNIQKEIEKKKKREQLLRSREDIQHFPSRELELCRRRIKILQDFLTAVESRIF